MAVRTHHDHDLLDRLTRLRRAHQTLAAELGASQRRVFEREREIRELRAALEAARALRAA